MRWVWVFLDGMGLMEGRRVRAGCVKVGVTELAAERNGRGRKCSRVKKGREMLKFEDGAKSGRGERAKKDVAGNFQKSELPR